MEKRFNVGGMTCGGCESSVVNALRLLAGVGAVSADHKTGSVVVNLDEPVEDGVISKAIEDAGYDVLPDDARPLPMA